MKRVILLIFIFIAFTNDIFSQENLETILEKAAGFTISQPDSTILFLEPFEKSVKKNKFSEEITARFYHVMGDAYYYKNDLRKTEKYYLKELEISETSKNSKQLIRIYFNLGTMSYDSKSYRKSVNYYSSSLDLAKSIDDDNILMQIYQALSLSYDNLNYYDKAYDTYKKYITYRNKLFKIETSEKLTLLKEKVNKAEIEKKQKEIELIHKKTELHFKKEELKETQATNQNLEEVNQLNNEKIKRLNLQQQLKDQQIKLKEEEDKRKAQEIKAQKRTITLISILVVVFIIFSIFVIFLLLRIKRANNKLQTKNAQILQQKEEIEAQRDEIVLSHETISKQNQKIKDSINYAKRIQEGLLPWPETIKKFIPNHFIYFKPRDIVSGDFYWLGPRDGHVYFAAADCTGHGVPGAFMSMLGIAFLTDIVNRSSKILSTSDVLENLRSYIKLALKDKDDGMDIALLRFDFKKLEVEFSGANNPLIIIRKNELLSYSPTHAPAGRYIKDIPFKSETIKLQKGDMLYVFSDGYIDQFGGEFGNKFMKKEFKKLLLDIAKKELSEQNKEIDSNIQNWMRQPKKKYPQLDDMLIVGIKI